MPNLIGQSLGRYHILEQLGEGGMATVYKAFDTLLERDVAVKVIRVDQFAPAVLERILKRFEREAKALARLTHPNIVHINDYGEQDGIPYLVMDYLPGGTLKQRLGKPIPWQEAARLLIPVAEALEYAHEHGIVHRDVKPSNILLTEKGQPMLTDFGIAKILESEETAELTGTGMGVGTPEYMAPEQTSSKSVDQRADIYSLGIVLYEMVTGRKPFIADTPLAVLFKQASEPLPRPRQYVPDLPEAVEKVLIKALAKKPEDRYQSMGEFANAMERSTEQGTPAIGTNNKMAQTKNKKESSSVEEKGLNKQKPFSPPHKRTLLGIGIFLGSLIFHRAPQSSKPVSTQIKSANIVTPSITGGVGGVSSPPPTMKAPLLTETSQSQTLTLPQWERGPLLSQVDFENGQVGDWIMNGGDFNIIRLADGNHVWATSINSEARLTLPTTLSDYAMEARIMQVSGGQALGILQIRITAGSPCDWNYGTYFDTSAGSLTLVESGYTGTSCDELRRTGLFANQRMPFSNGTWYKLRIEAKGSEIRVYLDDNLILHGTSNYLKSNIVGIATWSGNDKYMFYFDDIKVWSLLP
jgi:serine/threonine protein kinase